MINSKYYRMIKIMRFHNQLKVHRSKLFHNTENRMSTLFPSFTKSATFVTLRFISSRLKNFGILEVTGKSSTIITSLSSFDCLQSFYWRLLFPSTSEHVAPVDSNRIVIFHNVLSRITFINKIKCSEIWIVETVPKLNRNWFEQ